MAKGYSLEVHRKVFDDESGRFLTVRPSTDGPKTQVMLIAEKSEVEYFGNVLIDLPAEMMHKLGEALIACAREVMEQEK